MKMIIEAKALITYKKVLTEEETQKVLDYMEEYDYTKSEALHELWSEGEIEIYDDDTIETSCDTEEVNFLGMEEED